MEGKSLDRSLLRSFSPLDGLKKGNLDALVRKTVLRTLDAGRILFKEGDADKKTYYLVAGDLELSVGAQRVASISAGSTEARNPIGPSQPRRFSARALTDIQYIALDSDLLDVLLTWDQTGTYEVGELGPESAATSDDWMTTLLQTKSFHRIPPANLQAIFMRMERLEARAGDVIIKQGEEGDYFYAVTSGRCVVTRETPLSREGIRLAELGVGDTFGEEALIADIKRNATVTMLSDGSVMRLGKEDFRHLLNEPLLQWVSYSEAAEIVAKGGQWLDVRLPSEFENSRIEGATNLPLYFIRLKLRTLDKNVPYVLVCDTGGRSSAGAFLLSERGFEAYVLRGGLLGNDVARISP